MTAAVDVVVFGATSLTGGYVVRYLASHPDKPTFAIAGRSQKKLQDLHKNAKLSPRVDIVVADSFSADDVRNMVARGRAILNLAGPYNVFNARSVIEECIRQGRHYTDLTGESGFAKKIVDHLHQEARQKKSVIALSCGFDSMPFDVSTWLAVQQLKAAAGPSVQVTDVYSSCAGIAGVSKGTLMSAVDMASEEGVKWQMKSVRPDAFSPLDGQHKMPGGPRPIPAPGHDGYMFYSPFSPHNHRIVNRTWGLLETEADGEKDRYGRQFQWQDGLVAGRSTSWLTALVFGMVVKSFALLLLYFPPIRSLIRRLPDHWNSSTAWTERNAFCDLRTVVHSQKGPQSMCQWYVKGDAGYAKTAVMITEATLTIVNDFASMHPIARQGGVITTAFLGPKLIDRLRREGSFTIETRSLDPDTQGKKST